MNKEQITAEVLAAFALPEGQLKELAPYGSGHINDTFRVTYETEKGQRRYILQRMNKNIFEKPVELMKFYIENSSNMGDVVLDPFMGAGSTGIACMECHRNFIGIEIDERFFLIAEKRLKLNL